MITCLSLKDGCKKFRDIFYFSKIPGPPPPLNICRNVELLFLNLSRDWKKTGIIVQSKHTTCESQGFKFYTSWGPRGYRPKMQVVLLPSTTRK